MPIKWFVARLAAEESGAPTIEYGLICAAIALAILAALSTTGEALVAAFTSLLAPFRKLAAPINTWMAAASPAMTRRIPLP